MQRLPPELQLLVVLAMPDKADVLRLSCANRGTHTLLSGPAPLAAWLWMRHGHAAIFEPVAARSPAVLRRLIDVHRADVGHALKRTYGVSRTLLQHACYFDWSDTVKELLRDPAFPVNEATREGDTALHIAALHNRTDAVRMLMRHPATRVDYADHDGHTSLHAAVSGGHANTMVVRELLRHPGILVNAETANGFTALHFASLSGYTELAVELLRQPSISVNSTTQVDGATALHCAVLRHHTDVVRDLLAHPDIDVDAPDAQGRTALRHARVSKYVDIADMLVQHMVGGVVPH